MGRRSVRFPFGDEICECTLRKPLHLGTRDRCRKRRVAAVAACTRARLTFTLLAILTVLSCFSKKNVIFSAVLELVRPHLE